MDNDIENIVLDEKDKRCSPSTVFEAGSCIPVNALYKMAEKYNEKYPHKKIPLFKNKEEALTLCPEKSKYYLVKKFSERLSNVCDTQRCWLNQTFVNDIEPEIKKILKHQTFRPRGPSGEF